MAAALPQPVRRDDDTADIREGTDPAPAAVDKAPIEVLEAPEPFLLAGPIALQDQAPPEPAFEELVVPADSVLGLRLETALTSEQAQIEDRVVAQVSRDLRVDDRIAIPAGAKAHGTVTLVERGGRIRDRARLGVRFTSIVLADGTHLSIDTDAIYREGEAPGNDSTAKIGGGAIGGAIIGGIFGGAKGAILGGTAGAGAGTAAALAGGRNAAKLPAGSTLTVRLREPVSVVVDR